MYVVAIDTQADHIFLLSLYHRRLDISSASHSESSVKLHRNKAPLAGCLETCGFSELADEVKAGAEKIVTKNGESFIALIGSDRLDYYHRLERERIHLLLIDEAAKGLEDVAAGRVQDARSVIGSLKRRLNA